MNKIDKQVADLQQKIDYLIEQMALLTSAHQPPRTSVLRSPINRSATDVSETGRTPASGKPIGLNRFRALQTNP